MTKCNVYDANGQFLRVLGEDEIIKDGETVRVESFTMNVMDSLDPVQRAFMQDSMTPNNPLHRPGQVTSADGDVARRQTLVANSIARLSDAWKTPPAVELPTKPAIAPGAIDARDAAYDRRDNALTNAWRHA